MTRTYEAWTGSGVQHKLMTTVLFFPARLATVMMRGIQLMRVQVRLGVTTNIENNSLCFCRINTIYDCKMEGQ